MKTILLILIVYVVGCASSEIDPGARKVRVMKSDPPASCEQLGVVDSQGMGFGHWKADVNQARLRNKAAEMGGNYVRMDMNNGPYIQGTVFNCP